MKSISEKELKDHFDQILDSVTCDHQPVIISRSKGKTAILISLDDFQAYKETLHLMASKENEQRLNDAIREMEKNR
ncbi:type II toxin-antitoxin system Phd/YefM family antitoxin [Marinomonas sp.]|uniref:type II toxin-antitoxin system Phd/YefM family antitoxin n=1 Tax=Marinomonas sp. TaxID=1904862 RepID=UPI003C761DD6